MIFLRRLKILYRFLVGYPLEYAIFSLNLTILPQIHLYFFQSYHYTTQKFAYFHLFPTKTCNISKIPSILPLHHTKIYLPFMSKSIRGVSLCSYSLKICTKQNLEGQKLYFSCFVLKFFLCMKGLVPIRQVL